ncbi:DDE-domain-containing protein [Dendrothele bispora CBS 962.96]|uniref:DDE-domain-containing protein n=1 Tax=Dendrothele bispora (strain CBS 962.96) TaxID=1314807 RepID=A0A4S8LJW9_DENBC|nr:DDE-domain-containing protein [Dendrothele bispora CBS 962.96]
MLDLWVTRALKHGVQLTGEVLRVKWRAFAELAGVPKDEWLNLSEGWCTRYKGRNGLREIKRHGEAGSADPQAIEEERRRVQELIAKLPPDRGLSDKKRPGVKGNKVRLTYAFTSNADGSEKLKPLVIGKAFKPRAFGKKTGDQLGFQYRNNAKAWMTTAIYQEWLMAWDRELRLKGRRILLLQDNFAGHVVPHGEGRELTNIRVENFAPNLTAHVQPKDAGIIRCFKAHYRKRYIQRSIDRYDSGTTPADIYKIDQLEAMRLADAAWKEVDTSTIQHCWKKTGILPDSVFVPDVSQNIALPISSLIDSGSSSQDPILRAEQQVTAALNELQETGILQRSNRLGLEDLLNPVEEDKHMSDETSEKDIEKDICNAVLAARNAIENSTLHGGHDDLDDEVLVLPRPSRQEALGAVSTLTRYVNPMDDEFARKLESLLASFGRQTRLEDISSMHTTQITDYYSKV